MHKLPKKWLGGHSYSVVQKGAWMWQMIYKSVTVTNVTCLVFQIIVDNMCNIFLKVYLISLESHRTDVNKNVVADKQKP